MMSSILLNPQLIVYSAALGSTALVIRIVTCFFCGILAGFVVRLFYKERAFFRFDGFEEPKSRDTDSNLLLRFLKNLVRNIRATGLYFLIGIVLSALFQRYVPADALTAVFGGNEAFGVLMAATIGVPLYACPYPRRTFARLPSPLFPDKRFQRAMPTLSAEKSIDLPFFGKRAENRHPSRPSHDPYENNTGKNADAVDRHVFFGRAPALDKRLVVFVKGSKAHAEQPGHEHKRDASESVDIKRKSNGYRQNKIFCNVSQLADIIMDFFHIMFDLFIRQLFFQYLIRRHHDLMADFQAELAAGDAVLGRKAENHIHDKNSRNKRERL